MQEKQIRPFGIRDKVGYALGDFGCNMSFAFINNYLMIFYVTCMGIRPEHFAIIILLAKIFDAINDPIMGVIVDKTRTKDGQMRPYIKWAPQNAHQLFNFDTGATHWGTFLTEGAPMRCFYFCFSFLFLPKSALTV